MKAVCFFNYGSPEVLTLVDIDKPGPGKYEVLVKIHATAVNSADVRLRKADPWGVRLMLGLVKPRINVLGGVFSGTVEAVGSGVRRFQPGDEIFGSTDMKFGAYAEYKCFREGSTLALKPKNLNHCEAAVIPFGGTTALHFLRKAGLRAGQKILIYGASGSVGSSAVQLSKYFGASVTAVCSGGNAELVRSLGADRVIDYNKTNCLQEGETYDLILDTVNKLPVSEALKALNPKGTMVMVSAGLSEMLKGTFLTLFRSKKAMFGVNRQTAEDIVFLSLLALNGDLRPVIDRTYSMNQLSEAHAHVDSGHKKGNVAIAVI